MPYPYNNDLGKQPPPYSKAARALEEAPFVKPKATPEQIAQLDAAIQKAMMDKLFGANPSTIKFPDVKPVTVKKDFPGTTKANDYGKADYASLPEEGPAKLYSSKSDIELMQQLLQAGMVTKQELYNKLYKAKVLGDFTKSDPPMPEPPKVYVPPPKPPYAFTKKDPHQPDANIVQMKIQIEGIAGLEGETLYASQVVSKQFCYGNEAKASELIMKDMIRQIEIIINNKMKGK